MPGSDVSTGTVWPNKGDGTHYQALSAVFFLTATAVLSFFVSRRMPVTIAAWKQMTLARIFVACTLADSCLFVYFSGVLVLGIGTSLSEGACAAGIWWCIMLYASSKVFVYLFLLERLHLVWSRDKDGRERSRMQSPMYRLASVFLACWIGVAICMIVGRVSYIRRRDNVCTIGLRLFATVPMLAVDAIVNIYLTASFVVPIYRSRFTSAQSLALKSSIAAMAALVTSFVNIAILTVLHGKQLSWVCLMSCGLDVFLNATIIFMVTTPTASDVARPPYFHSNFGTSFASAQPSTSKRPSIISLGGRRPSSLSVGGRRSSYQHGSIVFTNGTTTGPGGKKYAHPSEGIVLASVPQSPPMALESWDSCADLGERIEAMPDKNWEMSERQG